MCSQHRHIHAAAFDKSVVTAKFKYNHCEQMLSPDNRTFSARRCRRETNMTFLGRLNISMLPECWYGSAGHAIELAHRRDIVRALMVLIDAHTHTHEHTRTQLLPLHPHPPQGDWISHITIHHIMSVLTTNPGDCVRLKAAVIISIGPAATRWCRSF